MKRALATTVLSVALAGAVWIPDRAMAANFYSGNQLLDYCTRPDITPEHFCLGFIAGISDAITAYTASEVPTCIPDSATPTQIKDIVVRFLQNEPTNRDRPAVSLILIALAVAFPCE